MPDFSLVSTYAFRQLKIILLVPGPDLTVLHRICSSEPHHGDIYPEHIVFRCSPARGRSRRIGQLLTVENFELSVPSSFQDRVFHNTITKALPTAMAELTINALYIRRKRANKQ